MKLIYILGLEHSGTTLTDHVLSQNAHVIGLGEVASFFSPEHMTEYMRRWGNYSDARRCSCGHSWEHCSLWKDSLDLCGLYSSQATVEKYATLLKRIRQRFGSDVVVVDSSKSVRPLEILATRGAITGVMPEDLLVIFACKDVRSFAMSISRKKDAMGMLGVLRTFNWWLGANRQILTFLKTSNLAFEVSLYENFCSRPEATIAAALERVGLECQSKPADSQQGSHIVMGNKNFITRNRDRIVYDNSWFLNDRINNAYLVHWKARKFNEALYTLANRKSGTASFAFPALDAQCANQPS